MHAWWVYISGYSRTLSSKTAEETGYEKVACRVCKSAAEVEGNPFYLCDGCDVTGAHHNCLEQVGADVPGSDDDWFCSDCEGADTGSDSSAYREMADDRAAGSCVPGAPYAC